MHTWQLQKAKSQFSELVDLAVKEGPQMVTRRGKEAVVILTIHGYRRLRGRVLQLMDCWLNAPGGEAFKVVRSSEPVRDLEL